MRFLREGQTLNKIEKIKLQRHPLEVKQAIIDTYSEDLSKMDEVPGRWSASSGSASTRRSRAGTRS